MGGNKFILLIRNTCSDTQQSVLHLLRYKTIAEMLKEPFYLQLVDQASTRLQTVLPSVLSAHHTARHTKMVQWTAGVRIIISGQTKTLHPWLVPVSSSAATHASMFGLFGFVLCLYFCFWGMYVCKCEAFAHCFLFSVCKLTTVPPCPCLTHHKHNIYHTKMNSFFKALPAMQPPTRKTKFCVWL